MLRAMPSVRRTRKRQPPPRRRSAGDGGRSTRERLLDSAERLFAERGIQGVSLRTINAAAKARNASAAHYHFQSKEGLIRAIVARRMDELSERRLERMKALEAELAGSTPLVRRIVEASIRPVL